MSALTEARDRQLLLAAGLLHGNPESLPAADLLKAAVPQAAQVLGSPRNWS